MLSSLCFFSCKRNSEIILRLLKKGTCARRLTCAIARCTTASPSCAPAGIMSFASSAQSIAHRCIRFCSNRFYSSALWLGYGRKGGVEQNRVRHRVDRGCRCHSCNAPQRFIQLEIWRTLPTCGATPERSPASSIDTARTGRIIDVGAADDRCLFAVRMPHIIWQVIALSRIDDDRTQTASRPGWNCRCRSLLVRTRATTARDPYSNARNVTLTR